MSEVTYIPNMDTVMVDVGSVVTATATVAAASMTTDAPVDAGPTAVVLVKAVPMTLIYGVIFVTGTVGNVFTCAVIARHRHMRTATNYYLFSLAVSDLLLLLLGLPQEMWSLWFPVPYIFGETVCVIRGLAAEMSTNASILTITAFTVERYLAICHPLRSHTMSKLSRAIKLILIIWIMAAVCAVPQAIQFGIVFAVRSDGTVLPDTADCLLKNPVDHAFELSTLFFFILPMSLMTVFYVLIGLKLRNPDFNACPTNTKSAGNTSGQETSKRMNGGSGPKDASFIRTLSFRRTGVQSPLPPPPPPQPVRRCNSSSASSRRAVIKMLVAVVVAFFVCWAPFHAQRLMAIYASAESQLAVNIYEALTYVSGVLYYVSATINPILYHIMSLKFRAAFKDTLSSCCCLAAAAAAQRRRRRSMGRHFPSRCQSKSINNSTSYYFNSTIRSKTVVNDNTDTTLELMLDDQNATVTTASNAIGRFSANRFKNGSGTAPPTSNPMKRLSVQPAVPQAKVQEVSGAPSPPPDHAKEKDSQKPRVANRKSDSISNSSMQMMDEEDAPNALELSNFMAELNELYDVGSVGAKGKLQVVASAPASPEQNNGNGYCVSRC